jgi:hypothetical protein
MKIKTAIDMELRNLLRTELQTLHEYEEMFDNMTNEEKDDLREWIVNGNSVNSNPYMIYGENGCLMDFINASRAAEDMANNPGSYSCDSCVDADGGDAGRLKDKDMPF